MDDLSKVKYRYLSARDAVAYKKIRMAALCGEDKRFFTANLQQEFSRMQEEWRDVCAKTQDQAIAGAFLGRSLIGVFSVAVSQKDITRKTAHYNSAYIIPDFRHTVVAKRLSMMREAWAIQHGCEKVTFTIKPDNPWLQRQIQYGAQIKDLFITSFADGSASSIYLLERKLNLPQKKATGRR